MPLPIKLWCSNVRSAGFRERLLRHATVLSVIDRPREGDLVIARALSSEGAYRQMEDPSGREVRLYQGDVVVGVLGTRKSGTNLVSIVPAGPLCAGDVVELAAVGGLLGTVTFTPRYYGGRALPMEVVGFFSLGGGVAANLREGQCVPPAPEGSAPDGAPVFVTGSSAEAGKTTFVCEAIQAIRQDAPGLRVAAIKACGTGRLRDLLRYADAGAHYVTDFVEAGWPSTYNLDPDTYRSVLEELVDAAARRADVVFVEMGGDLLEAGAPTAVEVAGRRAAPMVYVVNDALGAIAGLEILGRSGMTRVVVASMRQNQHALAQRLELPLVVDPEDRDQVRDALGGVLGLPLPAAASAAGPSAVEPLPAARRSA
ncbi:MAG TPA: hypothetical protein VGR37_24810 [Longimicrobiaceae bacterium]|nr:hypothetical protein [Longimicrobiaceae bacterium]